MSLNGPGLTYGGSHGTPHHEPGHRRLVIIVLGAIAAAGLLMISLVAFGNGGNHKPKPAPPPTTPTQTPTPTPAASSSEETSPGGEDTAPAGDPTSTVDATEAAEQFVHAWLDPKRETRLPALKRVTTDDLYAQVANTDPAKLPDSRLSGTVKKVSSTPYTIVFEQRFTDGLRISVVMVSDPQAVYGWLAQDVAPVEE